MRLSARMQNRQWVIQPADHRSAELAESLKVSPLLAQILINRGIEDSEAGNVFLNPKLTALIGPEQMPGAQTAAARVKEAVKNKEKIVIYGDYDVDGITSVAILWQLLTLLGADVDYFVPHRIDDGYGLSIDTVRSLAESGTELLITVDCGINALEPAELAGQLGLDLIITDHHQPGDELPKALAIVHPAMDSAYANQDSSGSMVAFKLAWAIANEFNDGQKLETGLRDFMLTATNLAAMGTVADIMDLRNENRVLTSYGLKSLSQCSLCGVQALIDLAGLTGKGLDSFHIGFRLGPMLNAAGRMGHARLAVELLTCENQVRSVQIAEYLKEQNGLRQRCERKIFKQACEVIVQQGFNHPDRKSVVLAGEDWHNGVIGIVASRIVDKYYRPTIIINAPESKSVARGSARSIPGFDILKAISACSRHLVSFGGHKMAAGVSIEPEKIADFTADMEVYAKENLNHEDTTAKLNIDAAASLGQFNKDFVAELTKLSPFGKGNPQPIFATKGVRLASAPRRVGAKNDHLQLAITDNTASIRCVGFGMGKLEKKLLEHDFFNIAYQPNINTFNGNSNVELILEDIQFE